MERSGAFSTVGLLRIPRPDVLAHAEVQMFWFGAMQGH
jgi:hypothetical protein